MATPRSAMIIYKIYYQLAHFFLGHNKDVFKMNISL